MLTTDMAGWVYSHFVHINVRLNGLQLENVSLKRIVNKTIRESDIFYTCGRVYSKCYGIFRRWLPKT